MCVYVCVCVFVRACDRFSFKLSESKIRHKLSFWVCVTLSIYKRRRKNHLMRLL